MQPLKLVIPGAYWDSQLYEGRLYLFGRSGDILSINWDSLIRSFRISESLVLAITCAFQRSDYLYGVVAAGLMKDPEIRSVMRTKFSQLARIPLEISTQRISQHIAGRQDNPFPFPHTDSEIYARRIYVSSKSGIGVASCNKQTRYPVSTRTRRLWDAPALGISASYGSLAIAAGSEGLFERKIVSYEWEEIDDSSEPKRISPGHCTDCGWAFYSVFGSSSLGTGILASYAREHVEADPRYRRRRFDRLIQDSEIFGDEPLAAQTKYSWASQDKICRALDGAIEVARYTPWEHDRQIERLGTLRIDRAPGNLVSAAVALFGTVLEFDSALVVIPSSGRSLQFSGEPVNWRVFPRSKHYENHLHIVYGDRIEMLSFNHDYLVDQEQKLSGTRYLVRKNHTVPPL